MKPSEKRLNSIKRIYGCSHAELVEIGIEVSTKFQMHQCKARARGVGFHLTLPEWWKIWNDSGHWADRGVTGYVMCRHDDIGAYAVGNVRIATSAENAGERRPVCRLRASPPSRTVQDSGSHGIPGFPPKYFELRKVGAPT